MSPGEAQLQIDFNKHCMLHGLPLGLNFVAWPILRAKSNSNLSKKVWCDCSLKTFMKIAE